MDRQVLLNYLFVFVLPLVFGGALRFACRKYSRAWLVTAIAAVLSLAAWVIARDPPVRGSELYGLCTIQLVCCMTGSLLVGLLLGK